jgi:hypothetical protein
VILECQCFVLDASKGSLLITLSSFMAPLKWEGGTEDLVQFLYISIHNYV